MSSSEYLANWLSVVTDSMGGRPEFYVSHQVFGGLIVLGAAALITVVFRPRFGR